MQTQHGPGPLVALSSDESAAIEPPDSGRSHPHIVASDKSPPTPTPKPLHIPSPAHLLLTHNNGPHAAHIALSAPHTAPPAPAGIMPPGRFRKLSLSDNHPIIPSPLHTECLKADDANISAATAIVTSSSIAPPNRSDSGDDSPLRTARPSDYEQDNGRDLQEKQRNGSTAFPALLNPKHHAHDGIEREEEHHDDDNAEEDDDDDEAETTPTSSSACSSDTAESEHSRTSYESSVLAPISEAPDSSFSSMLSASSSTSSAVADAEADTTPTVFSNTKGSKLSHPSPKHPIVNVISDDDDDDTQGTDGKQVEGIDGDLTTPTNSIIRPRSDSALAEAASVSTSGTGTGTGNSTATNTANTATSTATPNGTNLTRSSSGRRLSCPTKAKAKLRPCFRRRSSAQSTSALSATSSSDVDYDHPPRGRSVRFSPGPPQEVRTHSPVEYDRKSCAINHRLTAEDVEEMRRMEMGLGLLEAKWAAVAACKAAASSASASPAAVSAARAAAAEAEEAEIRFHSAAGVAGMRRSERHWDRDDTPGPSGYGRDRERERERRWGGGGGGASAGGGGAENADPHRGLSRPYSAGTAADRDRLAPPPSSGSTAASYSGSGSGLTRRGTLTRASSSSSTSVYNRADYSDSSESEYEMPRSSPSHGLYARPLSSWSASRGNVVKGNTDAPSLSDRGHSKHSHPHHHHHHHGANGAGPSGGAAAGAAAAAAAAAASTAAAKNGGMPPPGGWQPPDRCRNGYAGSAGWGIGGAAAARRSTTPVNGGCVVSSSGGATHHGGMGRPSSPSSASMLGASLSSSGIGAGGAGGSGAATPPAAHSSLIARFGLTSPPPPLPGTEDSSGPNHSGSTGLSSGTSSPLPGWGHGFASAHSSPGSVSMGLGGSAGAAGRKSPHFFAHSMYHQPHGLVPSFKRTPPPSIDGVSVLAGAGAMGEEEDEDEEEGEGEGEGEEEAASSARHPSSGGGGGGGGAGATKMAAANSHRGRASPISSALSSSSCASVASASLSGYDSPASEFCYESGSEYDLVG
ncbi:hypothetical protein OC834_004943 [Tilletia horrida]|nr:hypothetical protein OC834_004943 [Tilletia horrida]